MASRPSNVLLEKSLLPVLGSIPFMRAFAQATGNPSDWALMNSANIRPVVWEMDDLRIELARIRTPAAAKPGAMTPSSPPSYELTIKTGPGSTRATKATVMFNGTVKSTDPLAGIRMEQATPRILAELDRRLAAERKVTISRILNDLREIHGLPAPPKGADADQHNLEQLAIKSYGSGKKLGAQAMGRSGETFIVSFASDTGEGGQLVVGKGGDLMVTLGRGSTDMEAYDRIADALRGAMLLSEKPPAPSSGIPARPAARASAPGMRP